MGEANGNKRETEGTGWRAYCMCKERSLGLVKRIKWVGMKDKYKHLAKSNKQHTLQ